MSHSERVVIIGGGIAGLCAGIYAQRSGFSTTIFESQEQPGGVCASWRRGPYVMEMGLQMLIGVRPPNPFYALLDEVGVIGRVSIVEMPEFQRVEDEGGEEVIFYQDPGALERQLIQVGPQDRERVKRFIRIIEDFSRFRPPAGMAPETARLADGLRAALSLRPIALHAFRYWKVPVSRWLESFRSPTIREVFLKLFSTPDFPVLAMFSALGWFIGGQVGSPEQGSVEVVNAIADSYRRAGGDLRCSHRVDRVLVDGDRAIGVKLADGSEHRAEVVIGAADGHSTIFEMLGGRYVDEAIRSYYLDLPVFRPLVTLHYGVAMPITRDPSNSHFRIAKEIQVLGSPLRSLNVYHSTGRAGVAPPGHCVVRVAFETDYDPWKRLSQTPGRYREAKERLADEVLERLEQRHPGFARHVRVRDVATPVTLERYTHNWRAAYEGWLPTTRTFGMNLPKKLPGLRGFYMTGQWVAPGGGVPGVVRSARNTVMILCRDVKRAFVPR